MATEDFWSTGKPCLLEVPSNDLDTYYDIIVEGLHKVIDKGECVGWTIYSLYHELKLESSTLYIAFEEEKYVGFIVLTEGTETNSDSYWYAWIVYSVSGHGAAKFLPILEDMAIAAGHAKLRFGTTRVGWIRVAPKFGFEVEEVRYVKKLL